MKFNWLELTTKSDFLSRLAGDESRGEDRYDEWRNCASRWSAAEVSMLERGLEPSKTALKEAKGRTAQLLSNISLIGEQLLRSESLLNERSSALNEKIERMETLKNQLMEARSKRKEGTRMVRSKKELECLLDERSMELEKKRALLERQQEALVSVERLAALQAAELSKKAEELEAEEALERKEEKGQREREMEREAMGWWQSMQSLLCRLTGVGSCEMVRGDYVIVHILKWITSKKHERGEEEVPVHLFLDASGKLQSARVGAVRATPSGGHPHYKTLIEQAVELNDIAGLIRGLLHLFERYSS